MSFVFLTASGFLGKRQMGKNEGASSLYIYIYIFSGRDSWNAYKNITISNIDFTEDKRLERVSTRAGHATIVSDNYNSNATASY